MTEKTLNNRKNGMVVLLLLVLVYVASVVLFIFGVSYDILPLTLISCVWFVFGWIFFLGLKVLKPQEALVLTLFGKYVGTLKNSGFYFVNPFCTAVNPAAGTKLNQSGDVKVLGAKQPSGGVDVSIDIPTKKISDEGSLRGSSEVVAARIKDEIQDKVSEAGIEILEARITYLAYAPEIAAVMLQRQQASAIIDARKMIVDGAVGMVEMALERLSENRIVDLDDERKAAMVSNLLVVLCGNHDAQPVVNSGSLY